MKIYLAKINPRLYSKKFDVTHMQHYPVDLVNWWRACINLGYTVWELGEDELPDTVSDIRPDIINPPPRVFAVQETQTGYIEYWGGYPRDSYNI